jgi:hypothetical protein
MIEHVKCDIFESGADVILHQVNCQGVMILMSLFVNLMGGKVVGV